MNLMRDLHSPAGDDQPGHAGHPCSLAFSATANLAVSDLPNVDFPTIQVSAGLPGASPETMASSVATPLEKQFTTIAGLGSMTSTSSLGQHSDYSAIFDLAAISIPPPRCADRHFRRRQSASAQHACPANFSKGESRRSGHLLARRHFADLPLYEVDKYAENLIADADVRSFLALPKSPSTARPSTPCACD